MTELWSISLYQPWSSLLVIGAKPYETRPRPPMAAAIGQRIAIHAGKKRDAARNLDDATHLAIAYGFSGVGMGCRWLNDDIPYGAVVGTVLLRGAYRIGLHYADHRTAAVVERRGAVPDVSHIRTDLLGNYSTGRWAWLIEDPQVFDVAYPQRGYQGWWRWVPPAH